MNAYVLLIAGSSLLIVSYLFNVVSEKTSIPSVLMLILLGIILQPVLHNTGLKDYNFFPVLEVIGIVGLIMIVLEAALDLKLDKSKLPLLFKSFLVALLCLGGTAFLIAWLLIHFYQMDFNLALLYAIPISTISSAIVLPSVIHLDEHNKEFLIYESTFSDILGIMFFYFLLGGIENAQDGIIYSTGIHLLKISGNILITIVSSVIISLLLVLAFQNIKTHIKLFLLISVLVLLYAFGKMMHFSSLLMILIFGLMLQNHHYLIKGKMAKIFDEATLENMLENLQLVTFESSFVVRTFFFVIFGLTISLSSLISLKVLLISLIIVGTIFLVRTIVLRILKRGQVLPALFIAPRGLITILLFFSIPKELLFPGFDESILLYIILISSIIMAIMLINNKRKNKKNNEPEEAFTQSRHVTHSHQLGDWWLNH